MMVLATAGESALSLEPSVSDGGAASVEGVLSFETWVVGGGVEGDGERAGL